MSSEFRLRDDDTMAVIFSATYPSQTRAMAQAADLSACLWRPSLSGYLRAHDILTILDRGLFKLREYPYTYTALCPDRETYAYFVQSVADLFAACTRTPLARIETSQERSEPCAAPGTA